MYHPITEFLRHNLAAFDAANLMLYLNPHSAVSSSHSGDRQELAAIPLEGCAIALLLKLLMQCSIYRRQMAVSLDLMQNSRCSA